MIFPVRMEGIRVSTEEQMMQPSDAASCSLYGFSQDMTRTRSSFVTFGWFAFSSAVSG